MGLHDTVNLYLTPDDETRFNHLVSRSTYGQSDIVSFRVRESIEFPLYSHLDLAPSNARMTVNAKFVLVLDDAKVAGTFRYAYVMDLVVSDSTGQEFARVTPSVPAGHRLCFKVKESLLHAVVYA